MAKQKKVDEATTVVFEIPSGIKIEKVQRKGIFCVVNYEERIGDIHAKMKRDADQPVHADLEEQFLKLRPFIALICEQLNLVNYPPATIDYKADEFENYGVQGIEFINGDTSVVLHGWFKLTNGCKVSLSTPLVEFYEKDFDADLMIELRAQIDEIKHEIGLYMGGKRAPKAQTEMEFENSAAAEENND